MQLVIHGLYFLYDFCERCNLLLKVFLQFMYSSRLKIFCFSMHKKRVFHSHQFILTVWRKHILNLLVSEDNSISQWKKEIVNVNFFTFLLVNRTTDTLCLTYHYFRWCIDIKSSIYFQKKTTSMPIFRVQTYMIF